MKIKEGFVLRNVAGSNVICAVGARSREFKGIIELNDSSSFLFNKILEGASSIDELVKLMLDEYEIDKETARIDIEEFVKILTEAKVIE